MLVHANAFRVATRQQRRAGWRADRTRNVEVGELSPFGCQLINVRRLDRLGSETTEVTIALVIGKDNDEVWLCFLGRTQLRRTTVS